MGFRKFSVIFMLRLVVMRVQAQPPEVTLPGTSTVVKGTYIPYQESQFIGIDTQFEAYLGLPYVRASCWGHALSEAVSRKETCVPFTWRMSTEPCATNRRVGKT